MGSFCLRLHVHTAMEASPLLICVFWCPADLVLYSRPFRAYEGFTRSVLCLTSCLGSAFQAHIQWAIETILVQTRSKNHRLSVCLKADDFGTPRRVTQTLEELYSEHSAHILTSVCMHLRPILLSGCVLPPP